MSDTSNCDPCADPTPQTGTPKIVPAGKYSAVLDLYNNHEALKGKDNSILHHRAYGNKPVKWSDGSQSDRITLNLYGVADSYASRLVATDDSGRLTGLFPDPSGGQKILISQSGAMTWVPQGEANRCFEQGVIKAPEGECSMSLAAFSGCEGNGPVCLVKVPSSTCGYVKSDGTIAEPNPAGVIQMFGGTQNTVPEGWMICDGSILSTASYPKLFAAIGYNFGRTGSSFYLPDMRGVFARGADLEGLKDPDTAGRTELNPGGNVAENVGSYQGDAFQCHEHVGGGITVTSSHTTIGPGNAHAINYVRKVVSDGTTGGTVDSDCGAVRTSTENRPKNVNVNYIISLGC